MAADAKWRSDYILWVELFVLINLAFLSVDIFLAHSENDFRGRAEWIPFYFSLSAPVLLGVGLACRRAWNRPFWWSILGYLVGSLAIAVGLAGVIYHLDSSFFYERTVLSLTYAAPFAAPLAYAGLGFLLLLNRMVPVPSVEWGQWLLLMTLGGFFGNFVLSLTDHAENGFFHWTEWIPVSSSAVAVAFLALPFFRRVDGSYMVVCAFILLLEMFVGFAGFVFHGLADIHGPSKSLFQNVINGAPLMAPLLFPNLVLLGWIALWVYSRSLRVTSVS
jgi:hypothetical protein